jgi:hypothetical protein
MDDLTPEISAISPRFTSYRVSRKMLPALRMCSASDGDGNEPQSVLTSARVSAERTKQTVIGCAEYVDIPQWNVRHVRAKVDTGARTSALHVEHVREIEGGYVRFDVRLHRNRADRRVTVEAPISRRGRVRTSSGLTQVRIFVRCAIRIGPVEREIEVSLVNRASMIFRMLLGRSALSHGILVDPGRAYLVTADRPARPPRPHASSS